MDLDVNDYMAESGNKNLFSPKISVIVPVYKVEQYLPQCIESILNQTFTDFELLLINDGSPDRSGQICDTYAAKDSRIRVFHRENAGVSSARNLGLDNARGEWITFIDSDDYVANSFLSSLIQCIYFLKSSNVLVFQMPLSFFNGSLIDVEKFEDELITRPNFQKAFIDYRLSNKGFACGKLYNNELIQSNNIRFNLSISFSEDLIFMLVYLKYTDYIKLLSQKEYYYRRGIDNSLSSKLWNFDEEKCVLDSFESAIANLFHIDESLLLFNFESSYKTLYYRLICSMYYKRNKIQKSDRIRYLRDLPLSRRVIISKVFSNSFIYSTIGFLLRNNICLFDLMFDLLCVLRRK